MFVLTKVQQPVLTWHRSLSSRALSHTSLHYGAFLRPSSALALLPGAHPRAPDVPLMSEWHRPSLSRTVLLLSQLHCLQNSLVSLVKSVYSVFPELSFVCQHRTVALNIHLGDRLVPKIAHGLVTNSMEMWERAKWKGTATLSLNGCGTAVKIYSHLYRKCK